jgi:hypothetical protein
MDTRTTRLPQGEPLFGCNTAERPLRGYARSLLSLTLLLSLLHSILLSAATPQKTKPAGNRSVVQADDAQSLVDDLADPDAEPLENVPDEVPLENTPDEEGDSSENAEPDKDFLADETTTPHFNRLFLKQLGYGELAPDRFGSPLPGFSPPPERVA